jgi:UMF1 family MFS transporter
MYDLANQSFQLLINTLLFSIYVKKVIAPTETEGKGAWTLMVVVSLALVVLASPIMGAIADTRAWKKRFLMVTGLIAVSLTAGLAFLGPGMMLQAAIMYVLAAFCVGIGENFLGAFLPELATPKTMGRVSALGWSMSYLGALLLLALTSVAIFVLNATDPNEWRWIFVLAAGWFLLGMLPTAFILKERTSGAVLGRSILAEAHHRLMGTITEARSYRHLLRFLLVFFVYSMGTMAVVFFAGIIGDEFGFGIGQLTLLALVMALTAGIAAIGTARFQDRIGHGRTIVLYLVVWVASTLALAVMKLISAPPSLFWFIAGGIGLGLGGIGTASRAMVGVLTPVQKSAEFFGLWGMTYKAAGIVGPGLFGLVSSKVQHGEVIALFMLTGFFGAGLALMLLFVNEHEGQLQARSAEERLAADVKDAAAPVAEPSPVHVVPSIGTPDANLNSGEQGSRA